MFWVFLLIFNLGVEPLDLPRIPLFWRDIKKRDLLDLALLAIKKKKLDILSISSCLALFKIEQPSKKEGFELRVPNNNSSGWHPWRKRYPWGWSKDYFVLASPNGYFRIVDKKGLCFYFSFEYLWDCLLATTTAIKIRGIYDGKTYGQRWVGNYKNYPIFNKYRDQYREEILKEQIRRSILSRY